MRTAQLLSFICEGGGGGSSRRCTSGGVMSPRQASIFFCGSSATSCQGRASPLRASRLAVMEANLCWLMDQASDMVAGAAAEDAALGAGKARFRHLGTPLDAA